MNDSGNHPCLALRRKLRDLQCLHTRSYARPHPAACPGGASEASRQEDIETAVPARERLSVGGMPTASAPNHRIKLHHRGMQEAR